LWGESRQDQARDALRHALAALRQALPGIKPPILLVEGQMLALRATAVEVDVAAFEQRFAEGTPEAWEQASRIYGGDLLSGFTLNEPLFEEWLRPGRKRTSRL
jgi:DNA-binding SARP family transcriptional activator